MYTILHFIHYGALYLLKAAFYDSKIFEMLTFVSKEILFIMSLKAIKVNLVHSQSRNIHRPKPIFSLIVVNAFIFVMVV